MRRDARGQRPLSGSRTGKRPRTVWLTVVGLALSWLLIGTHPVTAWAAQSPDGPPLLAVEQRGLTDAPALARGRSSTTAADRSSLAARPEAVTSSEPDHDSLNPVYVTVTNPDHEYPCADPRPTEPVNAAGHGDASDACGAWDTRTDPEGLP